MKILVTGATGFIGSSLVPYLCERGHEITALQRKDSADKLDARAFPLVLDDISEIEGRHLADHDVVIHLAGLAHTAGEDPALMVRTNVEGTSAVLQAAIEADVRRFIFLSSVKVNGEASGEPLTTGSHEHPADLYGQSKLAAETLLLSQSTTEPVILRVPLVVGASPRGNLKTLLDWIRRGVPLPLASIRARRSYLSMPNLQDCIEYCLRSDAVVGEAIHVADAESLSLPVFVRLLGEAMGKRVHLWPLPEFLVRQIGNWIVGPERAGKLLNQLEIDTGSTERQFGWRAPRSTADCLAGMFGHLREP